MIGNIDLSRDLVDPRGKVHRMANFYTGADSPDPSSCMEVFPNVAGEAMSCTIPVVATDGGDAAKIAVDTGTFVSSRKPAALAGAMR